VAVAICVFLGAPSLSAFAAEFKATVSNRTPEQTVSFPISVKGSKSRLDRTIDGRQTVIIVDQERGVVLVLDVLERKYAQLPLVSFDAAFLLSMPSIIAGTAAQPGMETKPRGTETVSGYSCEKFAIVSKDDPTFSFLTYWISQKLGYPLKIAYDAKGERVIEVTKIREGPVGDSVFQVPSGYTLVETPAAPPMENPAPPPIPDLPAWVQKVPSAPFVTAPYQQWVSAGEIIRVKVEAGKRMEVSAEGETENSEDANFSVVFFNNGKPTEFPPPGSDSYSAESAPKSHKITFSKSPSPVEEGDETVVRVNKGRLLIGVNQCASELDDCPDLPAFLDLSVLPDWVREVPFASFVQLPFARTMSAGEMIRVKTEAGKHIDVSGEAETEKGGDATFTAVAFRSAKPIQDPSDTNSSTTSPVSKGMISTFGFSQTLQEADEIVVRVNKGRVLIGIKNCGLETLGNFPICPE
jgi:hypothetical protein